jgi:hypothetical protein
MNQQEILASSLSKTAKMRQLFTLGFTRSQTAAMMNVGYGFAQNVYAKWVQDVVTYQPRVFCLPAFNRRFGVEIEAFGVDRTELRTALNASGLTSWRIASDGSISGTNTFELVSPILEGQNGIDQLEKVCRILETKRAKVNKSCGLHIHFEARTFNLASWKNLFTNYAKLEGVIDSMMPESRRGTSNRYCGTILNHTAKVDAATTINQVVAALPSRYHKLNTKSFTEHGTVEFRQHSGTVEFSKISNWINFLHGLVSYSENGFRIETATFERTEEFTTPQVASFYYNRINDLAA